MKVDIRRFWQKLFYIPPQTWESLVEHCKRNCCVGVPNVKVDICRGCRAMNSWLETQRPAYRRAVSNVPQRP